MSGARKALESLYRAEVKVVYGFLWKLGAHEAFMDDLVHDVFITAARRWSTYDPSRPVRPWLLGIAFRVFSDARKRERPTVSEVPELVDPAPGPDETVARVQARKVLHRALATLPEERRTAFVLHELEGLSVKEVSEIMQAPAPTTYSRLTAAREGLLRAIEQFRRDETTRAEGAV